MEKKARIWAGLLLCIGLMLLPSFCIQSYAEEKATLNFIDGTVTEGEVVYDVFAPDEIKLGLYIRNGEDYQKCEISNGMEIDLSENSYYLKASVSLNEQSILEGYEYKISINDIKYTIDGNYINLLPEQFSGAVNIGVFRESSAPPRPSYPDNITICATYDGFGMEIRLNGEKIGAESANITATGKGYATGEIYNLIAVQLAFGDGNIGSITVNDQSITIPEGTTDRLEFTVAPSSNYNIVVKRSQDISGTPRTIIWESDRNNNTSLKESELIKNGTVEIIDIKDANGNSVGLQDVQQDTVSNHGWASVLPGYTVVIRLKPDYGYQLTSVSLNEQPLTACSDSSTFEFVMPDTNVHISSIFEKVTNTVNIGNVPVKNGGISFAGEGIGSGTAALTILDTSLTQQQIENFSGKAGDYQLSCYLDIKLDQILYKGTSADVWNTSIEKLNQPATIVLQLENSLIGTDVVVIHEKHDGTYETLPATYDAATQTVRFQTNSFSNYAIASRVAANTPGGGNSNQGNRTPESTSNTADTTERVTENVPQDENVVENTETASETEEGTSDYSPKTGDTTNLYGCYAVMAVSGMGCLYLNKKRRMA